MSTNIPRITQKIFAQNAAEDDLLQFGSVLSGNATPSTSIAETQTEAYQTGWRSAVISDRNYPTLGEMNAVQQVPTQQLAYLFQKGVPEWDASTTYFANVSYCQVNGVVYKSLTDNNIGNNPTTDSGTNWIIADFSNKLTNCILAAPQRIKLELVDGVLTLKAGSIVVVPDGFEEDEVTPKFVYKTVESDISLSSLYTGSYDDLLVSWCSDGTITTHRASTETQSGETQPTFSSRFGYWYDTKNNKMKNIDNNILDETNQYSLPFALVSNSTNTFTVINQILDIASFCGSVIVISKDLKTLISNGRNADKTLKNIEYAFDNDTIFKNTATLNDRISGVFIIPSTGEVFLPLATNIFSGLSANKSSLSVTMQTLYYATDENLWYEKTSSSDWDVQNGILLGTCEIKSNNFTSLFPYQPVSLAKEQDLDGNWTPKYFQVTTATAIKTYTYSLSNYLPNDGNIYEVSCRIYASRNDNIGTNSNIGVTSSFYGPVNNVLWCTVDGANFQQGGEAGQIIIGADHKITYIISGYNLHAAQLNLYAYRKVR